MSILKKKFNSVIALLLALIFLLSASVEISYAMDVDKKVPVEYEAICDVITMYFNYCDSRFQEKVVKTEYVSGDYKTNNTNPEYDSVNIVSSTQELVDSRADGLMKYIESTDITLLSWDVFVGKPMKVSVSAQGNLTCEVYVWTNFVWFNHDFPEPTESGFGTYHLLSLSVDKQEYRVVSDLYDEQDISGVSTISNYSIDEEDTSSVALSIISGDDSSIAYLSANTPTQLISRSRVVTYANQYVGNYGASGDYQDYTKYNRKYKNYNLDGGDCVNYVSQCLYDAGLPKKSDWTYSENGTPCTNSSHSANNNASYSTHSCTKDDTSGAAWRLTENFIQTITAAYKSNYKTSPSVGDFYIGDVGFLCRSNGTSYHAFICVATGSTTFKINAHNSDRKQVPYSQDTINNNNISRVHIHSPSASWQRYDSTNHRTPCNAGCGFYYYGSHYAQNPGANATCLGCGYVGYISKGYV